LVATDPLDGCVGFDWDAGDVDKNWHLHRVASWEAEEAFMNEPLVVRSDPSHARSETRWFALGFADSGRRLFVSFTIRGQLIRVISARDMTRKEERAYDQART
jgi:uncharacterized DUF497 family protein